jgi:hypothetical protein
MLKKLKTIFLHMGVFAALLTPVFAVPVMVSAQQLDCDGIQDCVDQGAVKTDPEGAAQQDAQTRVTGIIEDVINIFSLVVGVIAVIMIIIGGLKYITSGGDSGNVTSAKNTILYAIVGLIIVALAQIIVRFVLGRITV